MSCPPPTRPGLPRQAPPQVDGAAQTWRLRHPMRQESNMNEEDEPRELSLDEIDDLSMQAVDQITARLPAREYRTPKADNGSSSRVMEFDHGARFEVKSRPVDYRAEGGAL